MTVLPTSDAGITPVISPEQTVVPPPDPPAPCDDAPLIVTVSAAAGVSDNYSRCDHQHAGAVVWDSEAVDETSQASNIRANRVANSGLVNSAGTGITQFGSDTTGVATGAQANYCTIAGGDQGGIASGATYGFVGAGLANTITGTAIAACIVAGSTNTTAAARSGILCGTLGVIEAACTGAAIVNGSGNQIKDDPAPGTKLFCHSAQAISGSGSSTIITGSDGATILGGDGSLITASPYSCIIGGVEVATFGGIANRIIGSGIPASFATYSAGNYIFGCDGGSILGNNTYLCSMVGSQSSTIGTGGSSVQLFQNAVIAGRTHTINNSIGSIIVGGESATVGNNAITVSTNCANLGGLSNLIGTVTAGCVRCSTVGGNANAIQNASTNSSILGGSSHLVTNCSGAGILAGQSCTITTTATNSVIGGGQSHTITTALRAGIFCGISNQLGSGSSNSVICGGSTNLVGTVTAGSLQSFVGAGSNNTLQNVSSNSGIVAGSTNAMVLATTSIIGAGASSTIGATGLAAAACGILAGTNNIGTTASCTACVIVGGGNGSANSIQGCTNAGILAGATNTITTTATRSSICGGSTNSITTATDAHIGGGTSCSIASGSTNASISGGNTNAVGATAGCTAAHIGGGNNNIVSNGANSSVVCGGSTNTVTNSATSGVVCGTSNTVTTTATNSVVCGGSTNTITTALNSIIGAGTNNACTSGATASGILCGIGGSTSLQTQQVHAGGYTTTIGERQQSNLIVRGNTTGGGANESVSLLFGVAAGVPTQAITPPNSKAFGVKIWGTVTQSTAGNEAVSGTFEQLYHCYKSAGTVTVAATPVVGQSPAAFPAGLAGATLTLTASGGNLVLTGTTGAGNTIATKWGAIVQWIEVAA